MTRGAAIPLGVDGLVGQTQHIMQMRPRDATAGAAEANDVKAVDVLVFMHARRGEMTVGGLNAQTVVDDDVVATDAVDALALHLAMMG